MHPQRRSGRIAKELDILLLGTDASGKVFSEKTKTVVLSRHGAGIVSRYRLSPDETLTLRLAGSSKEAEVRLVGQIGGEPGRYVYGLAFVDPQLEFWPMEFPPPEPFEGASRRITTLECSLCGAREAVEQMDVEEDVYTVNESILRFCKSCGVSTPWRKSRGETIETAPAPLRVATPVVPPGVAPSVAAPPVSNIGPRAPSIPAQSPPVASAYSEASEADLLSVAASSPYSASTVEILPASSAEFALATSLPTPAEEAPPASTESSPSVPQVDSSGRRVNRRKHMRVRVNFHACVRQDESGDDIVECENVSKGGLCFRSRRQYAVDSMIKVAAPYKEGEPALFVAARIRRSERLANGDVFRYGVAYIPGNANGPSR